jgi:hypothetical protein
LLLDLKQGKITSRVVDSPLLHFKEKFVMLSRENELDLLKEQMQVRKNSWNLPAGWENRVHLQIKVSGISSDRSAVNEAINQVYSSEIFADVAESNLNDLFHLPDPDREQISIEIQKWVEDIDWSESSTLPGKSEILEEALKIIYGVK